MNMRRPAGRRNGVRHRKAADELHSAAIRLLRRLRKVDDETGITAPRLSALSVLVFGGPCTLGQLARAEQVKPPTMTRLVTALEAEGLAVRESDPADGRITIISATRKGRTILTKGRRRRVEALASRLAALTGDELAAIERGAALMRQIAAEERDVE